MKFLQTFAWLAVLSLSAFAQTGELRFAIRHQPKTLDPALMDDESEETVRYLTGGVLVRLNRETQQLQPEIATKWKVSKDGKTISFTLRDHLKFSDGTPFSADDVAFTMRRLMDKDLHSPTADAFRTKGGDVVIRVTSPTAVTMTFPSAIAGLDRLFDQVAIQSSRSPQKELAVLGWFYVAEQKPGSYLLLSRNPNYYDHEHPRVKSIRLDVLQSRDAEVLKFLRGELQMINSLDPEYFDRIAEEKPASVKDAGVSLDSEQMWFNQSAKAAIPDYKQAWFRSTNFRNAVSLGIQRRDLARVVFHGYAQPATGPVSPANRFWFNSKLQPLAYDPGRALKLLQQDGFKLDGNTLHDRQGHSVEFSIITNSGNKYRERMATMIQQDMAKLGITVRVVTLDFPSLIERISHTPDYEACLLGLVNTELDPNSVMNVWLSSSVNHQWNPEQKTPATVWEAEIDKLMQEQATSANMQQRKRAFDRVQEIVYEQQPFIYLVNKHALSAVSSNVRNAHPIALRPQTFWNINDLALDGGQ
jgi:peptide/nickel transport system substrate-binding protein